tara:strand:- start:31 stop:420 length:390 start_codon:yes stop_codon:yes gene_type:complete
MTSKRNDIIKRDKFLWKEERDNYLKWYPRLKRTLAVQKGVRPSDIELLLHIYDISFFTLEDLLDCGVVSTVQTLQKHIQRLKKADLVKIFEPPKRRMGVSGTYRVSQTGKFLVTRLYRILSGEEAWPAE